MTEQHIAVCEALDWRVHDDPEEDYVELEKYSPAGEDFIFGVQKGNFVKNVREYADGFDVDEHVELWIEGRGKNGVPATARELVEDAEAIRDSNGLLEDYTRMQAALLGPRKPCRILARIHGEAAPYLPTLGIWRPLDKTDRHLGAVLYPGKEVFLVGGCPKQNPPLFKAGAKQTEFCVSAQVFT